MHFVLCGRRIEVGTDSIRSIYLAAGLCMLAVRALILGTARRGLEFTAFQTRKSLTVAYVCKSQFG